MFDKDWIHLNRATNEYLRGAWNFVKQIQSSLVGVDKILCPCKTCRNMNHQTFDIVYEHLVIKGMDPTYKIWYHHGEEVPVTTNVGCQYIFDGQTFCRTSCMSDEKIDEPYVKTDITPKEKMSEQTSNNTANIPTSAHVQPPVLNSPPSVTTNAPHKCMLLYWIGSGEVIAEGRWSSSDPLTLVHHIPLGPNAVRVWVDTVKKPNSFLWRPTSDIIVIDDAVGTTIAWPIDKVKICE